MSKVNEKTCELCLRTFTKDKRISMNAFFKRRFCSYTCATKIVYKNNKPSLANRLATSLSNSGCKSHLWKGGLSKNRQEYYNLKSLERKARLRGAKGSFTVKEWIELKSSFDNRCTNCKIEESVSKLTKDHIIPISKGGSNFISNIQPLCQSCNSKKNNKFIFQNG